MKFERPPKLWIALLLAVVLAIMVSLMFAGCATGVAYRGPVGNEAVVTLTTRRHIVQNSPLDPAKMEPISTLNITNPSTDSMTVVVDCEGAPMSRTGGTRMTLDLPPRWTQHLLLLPEDRSCVVKQWR